MKNKKNKITKNINPHEAMKQNAKKAEAMLKQLANSNRLMILCNLVNQSKTVSELVKIVELSQSAISQHLAKLNRMGLVTSEKRGREVYYTLSSMEVQAILSTLYLIYCK